MTLLLLMASLFSDVRVEASRSTVLVVVGADGTEEFGKQFRVWTNRWESASKQGGADFVAV